ncbi:Spo12 family-domain-containing protein [Diplogelasinospora grovesii]|uniref:Spo12 family-domain-containing protein n=1 Tax=Diplogelasinospora grovesii TaxID=303347 RepID=A0AAN6NH89_9PEZI|nr:Spo12 family-domain-containing protein [Diplogelasinospora grovesii]
MSSVLAAKDVNMSLSNNNTQAQQDATGKPDVKSMEYHRQVLQSKIEQDESKTYISPSDNIMSPCTAKLNAFRNKQVGKVKPKSLFAQASAKKLEGNNDLFGKDVPNAD